VRHGASRSGKSAFTGPGHATLDHQSAPSTVRPLRISWPPARPRPQSSTLRALCRSVHQPARHQGGCHRTAIATSRRLLPDALRTTSRARRIIIIIDAVQPVEPPGDADPSTAAGARFPNLPCSVHAGGAGLDQLRRRVPRPAVLSVPAAHVRPDSAQIVAPSSATVRKDPRRRPGRRFASRQTPTSAVSARTLEEIRTLGEFGEITATNHRASCDNARLFHGSWRHANDSGFRDSSTGPSANVLVPGLATLLAVSPQG